MTANTKMTEAEACDCVAKYGGIEGHSPGIASWLNRCEMFLEGLQAGRAEMAEENKVLRNTIEGLRREREWLVRGLDSEQFHEFSRFQIESAKLIAQRAGGKK